MAWHRRCSINSRRRRALKPMVARYYDDVANRYSRVSSRYSCARRPVFVQTLSKKHEIRQLCVACRHRRALKVRKSEEKLKCVVAPGGAGARRPKRWRRGPAVVLSRQLSSAAPTSATCDMAGDARARQFLFSMACEKQYNRQPAIVTRGYRARRRGICCRLCGGARSACRNR